MTIWNRFVDLGRTLVQTDELNNTTLNPTVNVADGSKLGSDFPMVVYVEGEKMTINSRATNALDITRDVSTAVKHPGTPVIYNPITVDIIRQIQDEIDTLAAAITGGSFDPDIHLPWLYDLDPVMQNANVNFTTLIAGGVTLPTTSGSPTDYNLAFNMYTLSSGAQNDSIRWSVPMAAGTWAVRVLHYQAANAGQYTVQIDGGAPGGSPSGNPVEGYNSASTRGVLTDVTGIVIPTTGLHAVTLKMASKNSSSAGYYGFLHRAYLLRTA